MTLLAFTNQCVVISWPPLGLVQMRVDGVCSCALSSRGEDRSSPFLCMILSMDIVLEPLSWFRSRREAGLSWNQAMGKNRSRDVEQKYGSKSLTTLWQSAFQSWISSSHHVEVYLAWVILRCHVKLHSHSSFTIKTTGTWCSDEELSLATLVHHQLCDGR